MSHFAMLVNTKTLDESELEEIMMPYHEFECTGEDNEYVQTVDITDEALAKYKDRDEKKSLAEWIGGYYGYNTYFEGEENLAYDAGNDQGKKYGYATVSKDGVVKVFDRTNPNKKWDWYVVGGRYGGRFVDANGRSVDSIRVGDIDMNKQLERRLARLLENWDDAFKDCASHLDLLNGPDSEERKQVLSRLYFFHGIELPDGAEWSRENYENIIRAEFPISAWGFVDLSEGWNEGAEMGWWGLHGPVEGDWNARFVSWFESLDPNTYLTVVDCHI